MRKSILFFLVNLSLMVSLALVDQKTPVDSMSDTSLEVSMDIEDGALEKDTPAVNK